MIVTSLTAEDRSATTPLTTTSDPAPAAETAAPPTDTVTISEETTAHRLLMALDADGDGSVSKADFVDSALENLRNAGRFESMTTNAKRAAKHEAQMARRLERKFEKADANHDGSIGEDEMTAMMPREMKRAAAHGDGDVAKVRHMSVTAVAMALERYRASHPTTPDPETEPTEPEPPSDDSASEV